MRSPSLHFMMGCLVAILLAGCDRPAADAPSASVADGPASSRASPTPTDIDAGSATAAISFNAGQTPDADVWYTTSEGSTACVTASSPAQAVDRLHALGVATTTDDVSAPDGSLAEVVVKWVETSGPRSAAYYRKLGDCEAALPSAQNVPDAYRH